ncbi:MAG: hypothetical protein AB8B71_12245, partial [Paracoccaceae bacterium]
LGLVMVNYRPDRRFVKALVFSGVLSIGCVVAAEESGNSACSNSEMLSVDFFVKIWNEANPFLVSVPTAFLDRSFRPSPASTQDSLLLDVDIRGFVPWEGGNLENHMGILVTEYIDLNEIAQSQAKLQTGTPLSTDVQYPIESAPFGLKELVFEKGQTRRDASNIYVASQDFETDDPNGITDVIVCKKDGEVPYPSCQHYIDAPLADIKVSYRRGHLRDWVLISEQVRDFWDCATSF